MSETVRFWILIWSAAFAALCLFSPTARGQSVGLTLAYATNLSVNHFFSACSYMAPSYYPAYSEFVLSGFIESAIGMVAFAVGAILASPLLIAASKRSWSQAPPRVPDSRLPRAYIVTGFIFYFVVLPFIKSIPSVATLGFSGWSLMILGLCLASWDSWRNRRKGMIRWLLLALVFPLFTMVNQGFLGYGVSAMIIILSFISTFYRPKWKVYFASILAAYLGLSFFVTYLRDRDELREAVWYEKRTLEDRLRKVAGILTDFEFYDPQNETHLIRLDSRLNQNIQVGQAVEYIGSGYETFARGETLRQAAVGFIPRIIWPNKPVAGGSGDYVTQYTGVEYAEGTSVGMGQVFELYINFGRVCVVVGFLIFGAAVGYIDAGAAHRLRLGDWQGSVFWLLPGLSMLQAGGSLIEIVATFASSIVFCVIINKYVLPRMSGREVSLRKWLKTMITRKASP